MRLIATGTTINQDPVVEFVLEVHAPGGEVYEAHSTALVSRLNVPQFQPGRTVPVKVDPPDRRRVALDLWDCRKSSHAHNPRVAFIRPSEATVRDAVYSGRDDA